MNKSIQHPLILDAMLAEYRVRATEIQYRSNAENTFLQIHISAITAVLAGIITFPVMGQWIIFLIPIESSLFGLWWLGNSLAITESGKYIRDFIEPKVSKLVGYKEAMYWENFIKLQSKLPKKEVKLSNLLFITFSAPSCISLLISFVLIGLTINSEYKLIPSLYVDPIYPGLTLLIAFLCFVINVYFYRSFISMYSYRCQIIEKGKQN